MTASRVRNADSPSGNVERVQWKGDPRIFIGQLPSFVRAKRVYDARLFQSDKALWPIQVKYIAHKERGHNEAAGGQQKIECIIKNSSTIQTFQMNLLFLPLYIY